MIYILAHTYEVARMLASELEINLEHVRYVDSAHTFRGTRNPVVIEEWNAGRRSDYAQIRDVMYHVGARTMVIDLNKLVNWERR